MDRSYVRNAGWLLLAALCAPVAIAAPQQAKDPAMADEVMSTDAFLSGHPDLRFRNLAQEALKQDKPEEAFAYFKRAAWYADKPSQAMVAEMLWDGRGVEQDRPLAYAWMDLAAERGYEGFLVLRERYWHALDEAAQKRAIEVGQDVYARYGDAAAEPRLATALRRERRRGTGSLTGFAGNVKVYVTGPGDVPMQIDGTHFYNDRYWDPVQYRQWQDEVWMKPRTGKVEVGGVETVEASRVPPTAPQTDAPEPEVPARETP